MWKRRLIRKAALMANIIAIRGIITTIMARTVSRRGTVLLRQITLLIAGIVRLGVQTVTNHVRSCIGHVGETGASNGR